MAKKKQEQQPVETIVEQPKPTMYLRSEMEAMIRLFKSCHTGSQAQEVMTFYKKYVNPRFNGPVTNCGGCGTGFMDRYKETRDWCVKNSSLFIN